MRSFVLMCALLGCINAFPLNLIPPENQWAALDTEMTLVCKLSQPVNSCTWITPYGETYTLNSGLKTENGRLHHHAEEITECGIKVANVSEKDAGVWSCIVGAVKDSEVTSGRGQVTVSLASAPKSVQLDMDFLNVSILDTEPKRVSCMSDHSEPKPTFYWYVGNDVLYENETQVEDIEDEMEDMWKQTLIFNPRMEHANQTLRCVITHVALKEAKEASAVLRFADLSEDLVRFETERRYHKNMIWSYLGTGTVVVIVVLVVIGFFITKYRSRDVMKTVMEETTDNGKENGVVDTTDEESKVGENGENGKVVDEEANGDISKVSESAKRGLGERFASFFTFAKTKEEKTETKEEEKTEANEEEEKTNEEEEKTEEEETKVEMTETDGKVDEPKESRMARFFKMFKKTPAKDAENIDLEEKKEEEEEQKEEEEKKTEELEPEDKEKKEVEEEKQQPKNTDV